MEDLKRKHVGVLMGGLSREREISLKSGRGVAAALRRLGYQVEEIDVGRDLPLKLTNARIDLAVIMLHGRWGEDGTVQGLLEVMGIPYSGAGPLASGLAMDKHLTKRWAEAEGVVTPEWVLVTSAKREAMPIPLPVVVKPNREGSTLGVTIVRKGDEWERAISEAMQFDSQVLVEQFISGKELTVGLIDGKALPVLEIVPKGGFYDYQSKYTKGMTDYIVPARVSETVANQLQRDSERLFRILDLAGVARADFMLGDRPYFLEINTIPGMTETSLVPKAAEAAGISYDEICDSLVRGASLKVRER